MRTALEVESERGLVLVGTAFLEHELKTLLITFLEFERNPQNPGADSETFHKATKDLFGTNNPLSTFASNNNLAFALGLIQREHTSLDALGRIRNRFAHQLEVDNLRHPTVADLMERFVGSKKI